MSSISALPMAQFLSLLGLGFLLGVRHATEADHVTAVSTMVSHTRSIRRSSLLGALWGAGHTFSLLGYGLLVLVFRLAIPARLALGFEFVVGLMLIALGLDLLRKLRAEQFHWHPHQHESQVLHLHLHNHQTDNQHQHHHVRRPLLVGMIHGLAGSGELLLVVIATIPSLWQGLIYITIFGLGTMLGMAMVSVAIGLPLLLFKRFSQTQTTVQLLAGLGSVGYGLFWIYNVGVVEHLFR